MKSKKELKRRISDLEQELQRLKQIEQINTFIKKYDLPKCESRICRGCAFASKEVMPWGQIVVQGCTKDLACKNFVPETQIVFMKLNQKGG